MKVNLLLSAKADASGLHRVRLYVRRRGLQGKIVVMSAKTNIFIDPKMYDAANATLKEYGSTKTKTPDVLYHNKQVKAIKALLAHIDETLEQEQDKNNVCGKWLSNVVDAYLYPHTDENANVRTIYQLFSDYLADKEFSTDFYKGNLVMIRSLARYEMFVRATDKKRAGFTLDIDTLTSEDVEDYKDYLRNEKGLADEMPETFAKILASYPASVKRGNNKIEERGGNSVIKLLKKLKGFYKWLNEKGHTANNPFEGLKLGSEKFGTPYYIAIDERNKIASTPMPTKHLETQRDIFVFHCLVGCRVSDLVKLTSEFITKDNVLVYTPRKTKDEGTQANQARVPLSPKALGLIDKYKGQDTKGRLFPFISPQKYNDAIKEIFTLAGITRKVEVRNALTGEMELRPINEMASSHLARRTFVGNAYFKVSDPNIIGKMSGHTEGSRAFARYRRIEDDTLRGVINLID